jgi:hypothetical protein
MILRKLRPCYAKRATPLNSSNLLFQVALWEVRLLVWPFALQSKTEVEAIQIHLGKGTGNTSLA